MKSESAKCFCAEGRKKIIIDICPKRVFLSFLSYFSYLGITHLNFNILIFMEANIALHKQVL